MTWNVKCNLLKIGCLMCLSLVVFWPSILLAKEYDYINISNPFLKKTPVAVTQFKTFSGHEAEVAGGKEARKILANALNFTGYLKTMNPAAFLSNPAESGIKLSQINFRDWTGIGAELIVTGGIIENNGKLTLRLRLMDTFNRKLLVGKIYTGPRKQLRKMIHLFCSEISYKLTGKWGVFRSKIAFVSTVKGGKEIFVCDFDGKNVKQITHHKSISLSPSFSSDGKRRGLIHADHFTGIDNFYPVGLIFRTIQYLSDPGFISDKDNIIVVLQSCHHCTFYRN
ncbi:MAG: hypothetical protein GY729_15120, partial [Desulfobacteraceae bacterium]|nr:hypothetical protein [Desulfobacteraceae bacterium]